jgi:hypothetical protein
MPSVGLSLGPERGRIGGDPVGGGRVCGGAVDDETAAALSRARRAKWLSVGGGEDRSPSGSHATGFSAASRPLSGKAASGLKRDR